MPANGLHISSLAKLPTQSATRVLSQLTDVETEGLLRSWRFFAREDQIAPEGSWQTWLYLAGRGAGKTRSGAEWIRERVKARCERIALIAPTAADARDVMVEGTSGILSCAWEHDVDCRGQKMGRPEYEPSKRRLTWGNGAIATLFSAEEPERLRGPQHDTIWADELAAWWEAQDAWDMAMFGLRLGDQPQVMVSTTPRPIPLLRTLIRDPSTVITRATTYANRANLAGAFFDTVIRKYEGTRLGRQELSGELLTEAEGSLWNRKMLEAARFSEKPPAMKRIVIGIDPAVTAKAESNLTGIVVAGLGVDDRGYVMADVSGRYAPAEWARAAVKSFHHWKADRIVAEGNQGGDLVRHTIHTEWREAPVTIVHAKQGKNARAEPVAALYEQGRVKHLGAFDELEDQMCTWEPLGDQPSPDRIDALVWALTSLMVRPDPVVVIQTPWK